MKRNTILAAAATALSLVQAGAAAQVAASQNVGQVAFANSGAPQAQAAFLRGLAQLHNFEYPRAIAAFQEAQKADPGFAMAYWGEAMAYNHPVWFEQDADKARAALARLAPTRAERLAKARTEREHAYLDAVETLYGEGSKEQRDLAYSAAMARLHRSHPEDVDAAAFYALSLLGSAHKGRDFGLYMRAAAVLEPFYPANQRHPGVLHYLIHSYDDPAHAPLGLRAAERYGAVAPDAPHALHMTSHIFLALGDWKGTIAANEAAMAASRRLRAAEGKPPIRCGHGPEWLNYAYFQAGDAASSEAILASCYEAAQAEAAEPTGKWALTRAYADKWVRHVAETGKQPLRPKLDIPVKDNAFDRFTFDYGELLLARGKPAAIAKAHAALKASAAAMKLEGEHPAYVSRKKVILAQAAGLAAIAAGQRSKGLASLRQAAELESTMSPEFGPPLVEKPSFELLGEELLKAGRTAQAAEAFASALKLAPGRKLSAAGYELASKGRTEGVETASAAPHKH